MGDRLVGEIAGNRREMADKLDALRRGQAEALAQSELAGQVQQKALHQLAGGATDSLVAALQAVVTDFNHKVASQFGENYRELGDAVRQLLGWQEEYRETIRTTNLQLGDTLRQLGYAAGDFRAVTGGSEQFARTAERVARVMDAIEAGEDRLMVLARSMAQVTEDASGRIPFIEARIAELTSQMTRAVQDNQSALHAALSGSAAEMQHTVRSIASELSAASQAGTSGYAGQPSGSRGGLAGDAQRTHGGHRWLRRADDRDDRSGRTTRDGMGRHRQSGADAVAVPPDAARGG